VLLLLAVLVSVVLFGGQHTTEGITDIPILMKMYILQTVKVSYGVTLYGS
jgi:hypothetical protein